MIVVEGESRCNAALHCVRLAGPLGVLDGGHRCRPAGLAEGGLDLRRSGAAHSREPRLSIYQAWLVHVQQNQWHPSPSALLSARQRGEGLLGGCACLGPHGLQRVNCKAIVASVPDRVLAAVACGLQYGIPPVHTLQAGVGRHRSEARCAAGTSRGRWRQSMMHSRG